MEANLERILITSLITLNSGQGFLVLSFPGTGGPEDM